MLIERAFHTEGVMLVYSVSVPDSLDFLRKKVWPNLPLLREQVAAHIPLVLVANGVDACGDCDIVGELDSTRQFVATASEGELRVFLLAYLEASAPTLTPTIAHVILDYLCLTGNREKLLFEQGQLFARELGCPFFGVSAKTRTNVEEPFFELVRQINKKRPTKDDLAKLRKGKQKK